MNKCTIIRIHDLLPKKFKTSEVNSNLKDGFLFLARVGKNLLVNQNLGFEPTEIEIQHIRKYISTWGGGEKVEIRNGILEMELPSFLISFHNAIDNLPGARVFPNILRIGGDVYLCIEYHDSVSSQISSILMEFLAEDHIFKKELIYSGFQEERLPYLLGLYRNNGNHLNSFLMITTVWEFSGKDTMTQNQGVFQNTGFYLPKCFVHGSTDRLIFRKDTPEIMGNADHRIVDKEKNIVEFEVASQFYSDFYNEIIRKYSGPIFMHMEVYPNKQITYHIIERNQQALFLRGLMNHWKRNARKDHLNYILSAENLDSVIKREYNVHKGNA